MMEFITTGANRYRVQHDSWMDGGGTWFGQDYIQVLKNRYPGQTFDCCLEWCSGPAFIGFGLMDHNICRDLCAVDICEPTIQAVNTTAQINHLQSRVSAFCLTSLGDLPKDRQFDLVIANPPHYLECPGDDNYQRIAVDTNWQAHRDFYAHISQHLKNDGIILMQENQAGSLRGVEEFRSMIEYNGLEIRDHFVSDEFYNRPGPWCQIYYIEIGLAKSA